MKNNYGKTGCIIAFLLTTVCGIALSGCGDELDNPKELFDNPEEHREKRIEVVGVVVDISEKSTSILVLLAWKLTVEEAPNRYNIICEFLKEDEEHNGWEKLKQEFKGEIVTISGEVDILAEFILLRKCSIVE